MGEKFLYICALEKGSPFSGVRQDTRNTHGELQFLTSKTVIECNRNTNSWLISRFQKSYPRIFCN